MRRLCMRRRVRCGDIPFEGGGRRVFQPGDLVGLEFEYTLARCCLSHTGNRLSLLFLRWAPTSVSLFTRALTRIQPDLTPQGTFKSSASLRAL